MRVQIGFRSNTADRCCCLLLETVLSAPKKFEIKADGNKDTLLERITLSSRRGIGVILARCGAVMGRGLPLLLSD